MTKLGKVKITYPPPADVLFLLPIASRLGLHKLFPRPCGQKVPTNRSAPADQEKVIPLPESPEFPFQSLGSTSGYYIPRYTTRTKYGLGWDPEIAGNGMVGVEWSFREVGREGDGVEKMEGMLDGVEEEPLVMPGEDAEEFWRRKRWENWKAGEVGGMQQ